jgi:hypothetical protein
MRFISHIALYVFTFYCHLIEMCIQRVRNIDKIYFINVRLSYNARER